MSKHEVVYDFHKSDVYVRIITASEDETRVEKREKEIQKNILDYINKRISELCQDLT